MKNKSNNKLNEILQLAAHLIEIPSYSIGKAKNIKGIKQCYNFISEYLRKAGLRLIEFKGKGSYPGLYCDIAPKYCKSLLGDLLLVGHYDKVSWNEPSQIKAIIDGDWLKGRGAADMMTVVATFMVLIKDFAQNEKNTPKIALLLIGNEERGETEKWGTHHILNALKKKYEYRPKMMIVGERTGNKNELIGKIEFKNRGIIRIALEAISETAHTAEIKNLTSIDKILALKDAILSLIPKSNSEWKTTFTISYIQAGEIQNFNTTPKRTLAGFEIRPIPEFNIEKLIKKINKKAKELQININFVNNEKGIINDPNNVLIKKLLNIIIQKYNNSEKHYIGNGKLHATQARFAPEGCTSIVFGQSGIDPHSPNEAHFIPSIIPYYQILYTYSINNFPNSKQKLD